MRCDLFLKRKKKKQNNKIIKKKLFKSKELKIEKKQKTVS